MWDVIYEGMAVKRLLLICGLAALLVPVAQAGKNSNTVGILEAAPYVYGQTIHPFTDTPSYGDRGPYYSLFCYQGGLTVYGVAQYRVPMDGSSVAFVLSGPQWTGGAADCDLTVWHVNPGLKNQSRDAALSFHVNA